MSCRRACPNSSWSWSWSTPQVQYYSNCPNQQRQGNTGGGGGGTNFTPSQGHPPTGPKEFSGDYYEYGLYLHNWYRRRHGAGELRLVDRLNRDGDSYCATLAPRQTLVHSTGRDYGENLFMTSDTSISDKEAVRQACKAWYDEIKDYNYSSPGFSMATGHFTAMVWKSSTELGIGVGRGNGCIIVAGCYKVHPNMMGDFGPNVLPYRDVPETDDESSDEESEEETKPKKVEKVTKGNNANASKEEELKLSVTITDCFKEIADKDSTIGPAELKDWLNTNVKVTFNFNGFDELITKLLISTATIEDGEKTRVGVDGFSKILSTVQGMLDAYSEFDSDGSGTLDPFELKDALKEAGFSVSYKVFLTLYKSLAVSENGSNLDPKKMMLNFREYVLAFLLLSKLQVVQRKRSEKKSSGILEDFSLSEWLEEQIEM